MQEHRDLPRESDWPLQKGSRVRYFTALIQQLRSFWNRASKTVRAGVVVTAVLCLAAMAGVGIWSSRQEYVPIANNLGPAAAAEIVSKLDTEGIPHKLNFSGSAVLVPQTQWNKARLALGDLAGPELPNANGINESLLSDPSLNHFKILRHKETALARTIMRMTGVENATVHISQPDPSPFVRDARPTTASVVLQVKRNVNFTREQAASIVALMANSVEGLDADQVTVVDTSGRVLSSTLSAAEADIISQYEYRRKLEADLAAKAELMLAQMLGPGKAVVRVTADVDFTRTSRELVTYDPELKVKKRETISKSTTTGADRTAGGPAGASSNLDPNGANNPAANRPVADKKEENTTEYETPKTVDSIQQAAGAIKRLTVAAMVDLSPMKEEGATGAEAVTKEQVLALLRSAVGLDEQRKDQIEVLVTKLPGAAVPEPIAALGAPRWDHVSQLLRNASLGVASLVSLVLGWLLLRRFRPAPRPSVLDPAERARRIAELSDQALANPEAVARIIDVWLKQAGSEQQSPPSANVGPAPGARTGARNARAAA
jgi:flagellar M-ring protein FliF